MKKPINLNRLRAFVAVAEAKSFAGAARALGISQPTLSTQLAQLEEDHGVRLVHRPARKLSLTDMGRALWEVARPLLAVETEALALLEEVNDLRRGTLRIAADAPQHVIAAMAIMATLHPGVTMTLATGNSAAVHQRVLAHEADIGVVADVAPHPALMRERLHADRVVLVVGAMHPWAGKRSVAVTDLADQTLIEREDGSRTRTLIRRVLASHKVAPAASIELGSREAVVEAAALGLGVGGVFESELHDARVSRLRVRGAELRAVEYAIYRRNRAFEPVVGAFAAALRRCHRG